MKKGTLKFYADVLNFYEEILEDNGELTKIIPWTETNWFFFRDLKIHRHHESAYFAEYAKNYIPFGADTIEYSKCLEIFAQYLRAKYEEWKEGNTLDQDKENK